MRTLKIGRHRQVKGEFYGTPKEIWGFRSPRGPRGQPVAHARRFVRANAGLLGLDPRQLHLECPRTIHSLTATHVLLRQRHDGLKIHRGYVTVHLGRDGRVYMVKNRAVPWSILEKHGKAGFVLSPERAEAKARDRIGGTRPRVLGRTERLWYPHEDRLLPAFKVRVRSDDPRRDVSVYVHAVRGRILQEVDILARAHGLGCVFVPNPVVVAGNWWELKGPRGTLKRPPLSAYRVVRLDNLAGSGRVLDGRHVTTAITPGRSRRANRQFIFSAHEPGFEEVMAYYYVDRAIRRLEELGYRGRRRIFAEPIAINARGTRGDQSWYSAADRTLNFGTGGVDDAEDGEIILHEFGHALQDAICPEFGQSEEAEAMGEGFGDYLAASFFAAAKSERWRPCVMSWDAVRDARRDDYPALRRVDRDLTYRDFEPGGDCHDNGEIWSATLWDIFVALGRDTADRIIIESHFQLDGHTTFTRGARAMLDADRNLFRGRHQRRLRRIFRERHIPLL